MDVAEFRYRAPTQAAEALPFKIVDAELKGTGREGEMLFDRERGRVIRFESHMSLAGRLTIDIGGQETKVELQQEQKNTVRTLDVNPLGK